MWQLFITLYFSYLILGPHWIAKLVRKEPLDIVESPLQLGKRAVFISYVALLFTAWFLRYPSRTTFFNALLVSVAAAVAYHTRWGPERTLPMHALLNLFILSQGRQYVDPQTMVTVVLGIFYFIFEGKIYT